MSLVHLEEAITKLLKEDATIQAYVGTRIHNDIFPQGMSFPAIRLGLAAMRSNETKDGPGTVDTIQVTIVTLAEHTLTAKHIDYQVREILDYFSGEVDGVVIQNMWLANRTSVRNDELDINGVATDFLARVVKN